MEPHNPLQPHLGEAPMSLETGLIILAIGACIFVYLIWKLVGEFRVRNARRDQEDASAAHRQHEGGERKGGEPEGGDREIGGQESNAP